MHGCEVFGGLPSGVGGGGDVIYPIDYSSYPMAHRRALFFLSLTHVIHGALFFTFQALMTALPVPDAPGFPLYDYEYMRYPAAGIWVGFMVVVTGLAGLLATRSKIMQRMDTRHCYFVVILVLNLMSCIFVTVLLVLCALAIAAARSNIDYLNDVVYQQPESRLANDTFQRAVYYRLAVRVLCLCGLMLGFSISDFILSVLSASMSCRMVCQCCLVVGIPPPPAYLTNRCNNNQYFAAGQQPPHSGGVYSNNLHQYAGPASNGGPMAVISPNNNLPIPAGYFPHNSSTLHAQFALLPPPPSYSESVQNFLCLSSPSPTAATTSPAQPSPVVTLAAANATADASDVITVQPFSSAVTAQQSSASSSSHSHARRRESRPITVTNVSTHLSPRRQRPPPTNVIVLSCASNNKSPVGNVDFGSRQSRRRRRSTTTLLASSSTPPDDDENVRQSTTATERSVNTTMSASSTPLMRRPKRDSIVSRRSFSSSPPPSPLAATSSGLASNSETRTFSLSGVSAENVDKVPLLLTTTKVAARRKQATHENGLHSGHKIRRSASHRTEKKTSDLLPPQPARRRTRAVVDNAKLGAETPSLTAAEQAADVTSGASSDDHSLVATGAKVNGNSNAIG